MNRPQRTITVRLPKVVDSKEGVQAHSLWMWVLQFALLGLMGWMATATLESTKALAVVSVRQDQNVTEHQAIMAAISVLVTRREWDVEILQIKTRLVAVETSIAEDKRLSLRDLQELREQVFTLRQALAGLPATARPMRTPDHEQTP